MSGKTPFYGAGSPAWLARADQGGGPDGRACYKKDPAVRCQSLAFGKPRTRLHFPRNRVLKEDERLVTAQGFAD